MKNRTPLVKHYMTESPLSIDADHTLDRAHELMRAHRIRHLPVLRGGSLVGLLAQRDLHLIEALSDVKPSEVKVEEAMTELPYVVGVDAPLAEVVAMMLEHKYGSAVVMEGAEVVGMFTTTDALRALHEKLTPTGA
jgi:acetoin utilization protein AcuB